MSITEPKPAVAYLEPSQVSTMNLFCKNNYRQKTVN